MSSTTVAVESSDRLNHEDGSVSLMGGLHDVVEIGVSLTGGVCRGGLAPTTRSIDS